MSAVDDTAEGDTEETTRSVPSTGRLVDGSFDGASTGKSGTDRVSEVLLNSITTDD